MLSGQVYTFFVNVKQCNIQQNEIKLAILDSCAIAWKWDPKGTLAIKNEKINPSTSHYPGDGSGRGWFSFRDCE